MSVVHRRGPGSLASEVLALLWAADRPLTTTEVAAELATPLAYNSVQTVLTRLHAQGAVHRELVGRAHAYTPVLDQAALTAGRMRAMLDRGGDHAAVLSRFIETLSPEQEATLADLLNREDHQ